MSRVSFINTDELLKTYKLSFDADGVLINSGAPVIEAFNKLFKTDHKLEEVHGWFAIAEWAMMAGATEDEALDLNEKLWVDPEVLFKSPPVPGAVEFTRKLYEQGINLNVVTSRIPKLKESTINWFRKWMPWIEKMYIRESKNIAGEVFKTEVINQLGVRVHFEDDLDHARHILDKTKACVVFIPYTKEVFSTNSNRIVQTSTEDNKIPNLWHTYQQLKDKNVYVAQY